MHLHRTLGLFLIVILFGCFSDYANANPFVAIFRHYLTRNAALQAAKKFHNIPRSAHPVQTIKIRDHNTDQLLRQYNYFNNQGMPISIRQDIPRNYPGAINGHGNQGYHFNSGPTGGKLKEHWYFDIFNSGR